MSNEDTQSPAFLYLGTVHYFRRGRTKGGDERGGHKLVSAQKGGRIVSLVSSVPIAPQPRA